MTPQAMLVGQTVQEHRTPPRTIVLVLALGLFMFLSVTMAFKYADQRQQIEQACAQTGAAAKLDLSSFVPICKGVK